jgi:hypothetical protein
VGDEILNFSERLEHKFFKTNHLDYGTSARGGLEPRFRVLFSTIFLALPREIAISVENSGM